MRCPSARLWYAEPDAVSSNASGPHAIYFGPAWQKSFMAERESAFREASPARKATERRDSVTGETMSRIQSKMERELQAIHLRYLHLALLRLSALILAPRQTDRIRLELVCGDRIVPFFQKPAWRNWQTRWTQNPVAARPCGFEPLRRQSHSMWDACSRRLSELGLRCFDRYSLSRALALWKTTPSPILARA
jgi:hypothetical protein